MNEAPGKPSEPKVEKEPQPGFWRRLFIRKGKSEAILLPVLAVITALLIGGIIIAISNADTMAAWRDFFHNPLYAIGITFATIGNSYISSFLVPSATRWTSSGK